MNNRLYIIILILLLLIPGVDAAAWGNISFDFRTSSTPPTAQRPYQIPLNISNSTGSNNYTHVYLNGHANVNFTELMLVNQGSIKGFYVANNSSAGAFGNVTNNGSAYTLYYGNSSIQQNKTKQGLETFFIFDDFNGASVNSTLWDTNGVVTVSGGVVTGQIQSKQTYGSGYAYYASAKIATGSYLGMWVDNYLAAGNWYSYRTTAGSWAKEKNPPTVTTSTGRGSDTTRYHDTDIGQIGTVGYYKMDWLYDDGTLTAGPTTATKVTTFNADTSWDWVGVRAFNVTAVPTWGTWSAEEALYSNNFTNNQSLSFTIPPGYPLTLYYNSTIAGAFGSCGGSSCPLWQLNGVTDATAQGSASFSPTITSNSTVRAVSIDVQTDAREITWTINVSSTPELIYPLNGTVIIAPYPPLAYTMNFSWYDLSNSQIQVASDVNFNLLLLSATTATQEYDFDLQAGTYFWRIRHQNSTTGAYGDWTDAESFTISASTAALSGTNIQGIVFETINGITYAIPDAILTLTNSSLNNSFTTKSVSNGYYLFQGLSNNTTYSLDVQAVGYDTPNRQYITTANSTITNNIELHRCTSSFNCYFNAQFVRFQVQGIWGDVYPGVTVSAYEGSSTTTILTGQTDSTGSIDFLLKKEIEYRITFVSTADSIDVTWRLYPKEDYYVLIIQGSESNAPCAAVNATLHSDTINSTHNALILNYSDQATATTSITYYVIAENGTGLYSTSGAGVGYFNASFDVARYNATAGITYYYGYNGTSSNCGPFSRFKVISFPPLSGKRINIGLSDGWLQTISIILLFTIGALFGARSVGQGAIVVSFTAAFFSYIGWFTAHPNSVLNTAIIGTAITLSILSYMREKETKNTS